jgi:hypothetical protein
MAKEGEYHGQKTKDATQKSYSLAKYITHETKNLELEFHRAIDERLGIKNEYESE